MLPPPPSATLEANPNFATLYKLLTEDILAPDGSTLSKAREYDVVSAQLSEARQSAARDGILLRALEEVALTGNSNDEPESRLPRPTDTSHTLVLAKQEHDAFDLPPELRELVYNVTSYISASLEPFTRQTLPADTDELMADELLTFQQRLPTISKAVSTHLADTESSLAALAIATASSLIPNPRPSTSHHKPPENHPSSLSAILSAPHSPNPNPNSNPNHHPARHSQSRSNNPLLPLHSSSPLTHPHPLSSTTTPLTTLLTSHTHTLQTTIRTLELTTHGTTSRHTLSRATYLASVSRGIELKARIMRLEREKALYGDGDVTDRLEGEGDALGVEERRLARQERDLRALLGEYEREGGRAAGRIGSGGGDGARRGKEEGTGEDVFRALGGRYAEIEKEMEEVKKDIERLETKVWRER